MGQAMDRRRLALVVDDDREQADLAAVLLEEADFEVIEAMSALEASQILRERNGEVALVFTDIWFNRSADGVTLAQEIAANWPWIKLIVTSGGPVEETKRLPKSATFVQKPWRALDILVMADNAGRG